MYAASWEGRPSEIFMTAEGSPESRGLGLQDVDLVDVSRAGGARHAAPWRRARRLAADRRARPS